MRTRLKAVRDQRGSALIISLVLIVIMAFLGLALFELGTVEARLVYVAQDDARALEIAQAGVERAMSQLQQTYNSDLTWATGSAICSGGGHRGCSDGQFYPADAGYISN